MSDGELLDAREAMSLLGVNETDLQTMVARGSLRAFRSAGTMKFRRDDVVGLKPEKKSDPAIVAPAAAPKTKPGSGILPTVASNKSPRGSSRNLPAIRPAATLPAKGSAPKLAPAPAPVVDTSTSSDQIILEDFELAPAESDSASNTQNVTASQTAVSGGVTVVDAELETGNQTVVEQGIDIDTASATASALSPIPVASATTTTSSGRTKVPSGRITDSGITNAPAMSRVRAAVSASSQSTVQKRAAAAASARTSHPIMTLILTLTAGIYLYTATIVGVVLFKGSYDPETHQRVIPPFLANAPLVNYVTAYTSLPGNPEDTEGTFKRPKDEPPGGGR